MTPQYIKRLIYYVGPLGTTSSQAAYTSQTPKHVSNTNNCSQRVPGSYASIDMQQPEGLEVDDDVIERFNQWQSVLDHVVNDR
jgi:hypothetical protein